MKKILSIMLILAVLLAFATPAAASPAAWVVPTFSIVSVVPDQSVTVRTYNFPANDSFDVLMNFIGTRGKNGFKVATVNSGSGGTFTATYNLPTELKGQYQIAIRLQSNTGSGYFAYNWFYNNLSGTNTGGGGETPPGYSGIPTFSIVSAVRDTSVTIKTHNFPANDSFDVLMGKMGTRGKNGIKVATVSSGSGGTFTATYTIPDELKGQYQIAIRLQSNTGSGYFAYNWFYNNTSGTGTGGGDDGSPSSGYTGVPRFSIVGVVRDTSVTVKTYNFPANDSFDVLMGPMGTRGVNGVYVTSVNSGSGGTMTFTFNVPASLAGSYQVAIRLQSNTGSGYYAYNWFYNSTTP